MELLSIYLIPDELLSENRDTMRNSGSWPNGIGDKGKQTHWRSAAFRIASVYFAVASLYILTSDSISKALIGDAAHMADVSILKGLVFVLTTSAGLYVLTKSLAGRIEAKSRILECANQELHDTQRSQSDILNSIPGFIYVKDCDFRYSFVNLESASLFGLDPADMIGKTDAELFAEDFASLMQELDREVVESGYSVFREITLGEGDFVRYFAVRRTPLTNDAGEIIGVCGISTETTEQTLQQRALAESEARLQLALSGSKMSVWEIDPETRVVTRGSSAPEVTGLASGPGSIDDFLGVVHEADRDFVRNAIQEAISGSDELDITCRIQKEGEYRYVHAFGRMMDRPGMKRVVAGGLRDVTEIVLLEQAQDASRVRRDALFDRSMDGIVILRMDGSVIEANASFAEMIGRPFEEVPILHIWDWDCHLSKTQILDGLSHHNPNDNVSTRFRRPDDSEIDVEVTASYGVINGEEILLCVCHDVTERNQRERALAQREEQFRTLIEASPNGLLVVDHGGVIRRANREAELIFGYSREEMVGQCVEMLVPDSIGARHDRLRLSYAKKPTTRSMGPGREVFGKTKAGTQVRLEVGLAPIPTDEEEQQFIVTCVDATERYNSEERMRRMALLDDLTGLPNRHGFVGSLERDIEVAAHTGDRFAVIWADIDRFRDLNDNHGHDFGDLMIQTVARRIQSFLGPTDVLARVGGDELAILLHCDDSESQRLESVLNVLTGSFDEPVQLDDIVCYVSVSFGACVFPTHADSSKGILQCLDIALYEAKMLGRGRYAVFSDELGTNAKQRHQTEVALRRAVEEDQFRLFYQPIVDIKTGELIGAEALVRWEHPDLGIVPPDRFISLAEETNLIVPLGRWILRTAAFQGKEWSDRWGMPFKMSVNFSPKQFLDVNLVNDFAKALEDSGIAPGCLQVEITEGMLMANPAESVETLSQFRAMGALIAIDDFGTGYSSLGYLHRYPLDCLKVDRSFVMDVLDDKDSATICRTIIQLAQSLKMSVVAEGVETGQHLAFLAGLGCDMAQGYWYSRPLPADQFEDWVHSRMGEQKLAA